MWESLQHHKAFEADAATYGAFRKAVSAVFDGVKGINDIIIDSADTYNALDAPLTEIASFEEEREVDTKLYAEGFRKLVDAIVGAGKPAGVYGGIWGPAIGKEKETLIALVGWETLEVSSSTSGGQRR